VLGLLVEIAVAETLADLGSVIPAGVANTVCVKSIVAGTSSWAATCATQLVIAVSTSGTRLCKLMLR
jgi:hypothetical protein